MILSSKLISFLRIETHKKIESLKKNFREYNKFCYKKAMCWDFEIKKNDKEKEIKYFQAIGRLMFLVPETVHLHDTGSCHYRLCWSEASYFSKHVDGFVLHVVLRYRKLDFLKGRGSVTMRELGHAAWDRSDTRLRD